MATLTIRSETYPVFGVWVFRRGKDGLIYKHTAIKLQGEEKEAHYSIVVLGMNDDHRVCNYGHTYIAVRREHGNGGAEFPMHVLDKIATESGVDTSTMTWDQATPTYYGMTACVVAPGCHVFYPTVYRETTIKLISQAYAIVGTLKNNPALKPPGCTEEKDYQIPMIGFTRSAQLRSMHSSLPTPGCAGIEELAAYKITPRVWKTMVEYSLCICGYVPRKGSAAQQQRSIECVAWVALTSIGFLQQWCCEQRDNITNIFFSTHGDCDDSTVKIVGTLHWIQQHADEYTRLPGDAGKMARLLLDMIEDAYFVSMYVRRGMEVGKATANMAGHCLALAKIRPEYRRKHGWRAYALLEGTLPQLPHCGDMTSLYGDGMRPAYTPVRGVTWGSPTPYDPDTYLMVGFMATPVQSMVVGPEKGAFVVGVPLEDILDGRFRTKDLATPSMKQLHCVFSGFCEAPVQDPTANTNLQRFMYSGANPLAYHFIPHTQSKIPTLRAAATITARDYRPSHRPHAFFSFPYFDVACTSPSADPPDARSYVETSCV